MGGIGVTVEVGVAVGVGDGILTMIGRNVELGVAVGVVSVRLSAVGGDETAVCGEPASTEIAMKNTTASVSTIKKPGRRERRSIALP